MISQPHTPPECEHHWKSYLQPKNVGLRWIRQCSQCGDFDTVNLREQVAAAPLLKLLEELVDPDDCWFDHHGGCQAHGFISLEPGETCPHQDAKELIRADQEGAQDA